MLCLHNAQGIFRKFSWLYYLYLAIYNWWVLFVYEKFLVYKLETFKKCKEVKHIMTTAIAIIYIFLSDVISHQQMKITFRKSLGPPLTKFTPSPAPIFTKSHLKIQKLQVPHFFQNCKSFRNPCRNGEDARVHRSVLCKITTDLLYFWDVYDVDLLEKNIGRSTAYSCRTNVFI